MTYISTCGLQDIQRKANNTNADFPEKKLGSGLGLATNPLGMVMAGTFVFFAATVTNSSIVAPHCSNHRRVLLLHPLTLVSKESPDSLPTMAKYKSKSATVGVELGTKKLLLDK